MIKYPGLHPASNIIIGAVSVPVIALVFYFYFSLTSFLAWIVGLVVGIAVNNSWFYFMDRNLNIFLRFLQTGKGLWGMYPRSVGGLVLNLLICVLAAIFYFYGFAAILAYISGVCLSGLLFYKSQKDFYVKLVKKPRKSVDKD